MLTIPSRVEYIARLLQSLAAMPSAERVDVVVIFNAATDEEPLAIEQRIRAMAPSLPIRVYVNSNEPSIGSGRRMQLSVCRTPLVAFIDDDLTVHGDIIGTIEDTLRSTPLGIVGLPSYEEDTDTRFKPRDSTPSVEVNGVRYMPVQGMLVAGYRRLFAEIGGFNPRRLFWGEWTEFNLRMWRNGFPTGYVLDGGYLRHWHKAPESPTRNMTGREQHVLWGLMCTALEYDAVSINEATDAFWRLAQDRYLAYSFGEQPSPKQLLASVLELMPKLSREWPAMHAFAEDARRHPFQFKPFEPLSEEQVRVVLASAQQAMHAYRPEEFFLSHDVQQAPRPSWVRRIGRAVFRIPTASA
ncbi:glycosyltransferase family 2 protein [Gemmatimonas groenlandica]|uniref:Glycosyltransferase family 2 protein n=1 Tax=Gemmatimonas groenlandica TaxID=2732249 RepID=A0A6M4IUU4_9BACT|nr:glycosyltransferase family A protein [Gemmatimonas groenlandica]QJR36592.1 glycosyltransferase family 2 protein [Gemmatimonas groenlandica]